MRTIAGSMLLLLGMACATPGSDPTVPPPPPPPPGPPPPGPALGPELSFPTLTVIAEDDSGFTPITVARCSDPRLTLGQSNNPNHIVTLRNDTIISRFAPDTWGSAAVALHLACTEGTIVRGVPVRVDPQPDVPYSLTELAGADHELGPIRVRINGEDRIVAPGGGRLQFLEGSNTLELAANPGWRDLQVWIVNGMTVPLNLNRTSFTITIPGAEDGGTLDLKVLHATAHPWYRAGSQSETDVRAIYWDHRPLAPVLGFQGLGGQVPLIFSPPNQHTFDGLVVCDPQPDDVRLSWGAAIDSMRAPYAGLPQPFDYEFFNTTESIIIFSIVDGMFFPANNWSLTCDAPVPQVETYFFTGSMGQRANFVARAPSGATLDDRIAALWRLPRKLGQRVTGSTWVSDGRVPGPADLKVAEHFFPLADSAWARGMPSLRF